MDHSQKSEMEILRNAMETFAPDKRTPSKSRRKAEQNEEKDKMIDIHTHILPGLDDGADDYEEACIMAEMAVRSGVNTVIATPHSNDEYGFYNEESSYMKEKFEKLCRILKQEEIPLQMYRGMEIWASADIAEKIQTGRLLSLNQSRYVLIEFAFTEEPWWFEAVIAEIIKAGLVPIIAHPERYISVQENPALVPEWYKLGALAQMNKGSLQGRFGRAAAHTAEKLLKNQMYSFVASDAHHHDIRTTDMHETVRYLRKYYDEDYTAKLLYQNPLAVLENRRIQSRNLPVYIE